VLKSYVKCQYAPARLSQVFILAFRSSSVKNSVHQLFKGVIIGICPRMRESVAFEQLKWHRGCFSAKRNPPCMSLNYRVYIARIECDVIKWLEQVLAGLEAAGE
jgi:hypothetical protein